MASQSLGKGVLKITADGAEFDRNLANMKKMAMSFAKDFAKIALPVMGVNALKQTIMDLENISDEAVKAGMGIEEFTRLTGGMDADDFAATTTALAKTRKLLAEIAGGSEETIKKLKEVGLDPDALVKQGTGGAVQTIAKHMTEAKTATEQAEIGLNTFGKSAMDIMPVVDQLANPQNTLRILTDEDIDRVILAKDALTQLDLGVKGLKERLAIEFAATFETVAQGFMMMIDGINSLAGQNAPKLTIGEGINLGLSSIIAASGEAIGVLPEDTTLNVIEDAGREWKAKQDRIAKMKADMEKLNKAREELQARMDAPKEKKDDFKLPEMDAHVKEYNKAMEDAKKVTEDALTPLEQFRKEIQNLNMLQQSGMINAETWKRSISNAFAQLPKLDEVKPINAHLAGSSEATDTILNTRLKMMGGANRGNDMVKILEQAKAEEKRTADNTEKLVNILENKGFLSPI